MDIVAALKQHLPALLLGLWPFWFGLPYGMRLVRRAWPEVETQPSSLLPTAVTTGLAVPIGVTFALLTVGFCKPWVLVALSVPSLWLWIRDRQWWMRTLRMPTLDRAYWKSEKSLPALLLGAVGLLLLLLSLLPPINYDAHEYHLAVPQGYLEQGGWTAFPGNVFAGFPMNVELLYLWGLSGGRLASTTVMHTLMALCAALACVGLAKQLGLRTPSLAGLLYLGSGLVQGQCLHANIDHGVTLFAAVAYVTLFASSKNRRGTALLAGIAIGLALGSKYVSLLSVAIPFLAIWLLHPTRRFAVHELAVLLGVAALGVLPWLLKNIFLYGNPVYPLLPSLFNYASWDEASAVLFKAATAPKPMSAAERFSEFFHKLVDWTLAIPQVGALGLAGWLVWATTGHIAYWGMLPLASPGKPTTDGTPYRLCRLCAVGFIVGAGVWFFLTHGVDRFLLPLLPLAAVASVAGLERIPPGIGRAIVWFGSLSTTCLLTFSLLPLQPLNYLVGVENETGYLQRVLPHYRAIEYLNNVAEEETINVLFVGEAQETGSHFPRIVTTVFNRHPLPKTDSAGNTLPTRPAEARERLATLGVTHILFNLSELNWLRNGYGPWGWQQGQPLRMLMVQLEADGTLVREWEDRPGLAVYRVVIRLE